MKEINEQVSEIKTRSDLIAFIEALRMDLQAQPRKWENASLDSFLGALASWAEDMDGYYENKGLEIPKNPTWRTFGEMLAAARIYE